MKTLLKFHGLCLVLVLSGCGGGPGDTPEIGEVYGTIKIDGKAASGVEVTFQPEKGRPSFGTTDDSGYYTLRYSASEEGAKVGKGVISISTPEPELSEEERTEKEASLEESEELFVDPIPAKYNAEAADNPEMNVEIKPGDNEFNFDIETK